MGELNCCREQIVLETVELDAVIELRILKVNYPEGQGPIWFAEQVKKTEM